MIFPSNATETMTTSRQIALPSVYKQRVSVNSGGPLSVTRRYAVQFRVRGTEVFIYINGSSLLTVGRGTAAAQAKRRPLPSGAKGTWLIGRCTTKCLIYQMSSRQTVGGNLKEERIPKHLQERQHISEKRSKASKQNTRRKNVSHVI